MKKAYIQLHLSIFLGGFTGIFGKLISLNEGLLVWYRLLFSALILLLFGYFSGRKTNVSFPAFLRIGTTGLLLALFWMFFYASIRYSNISIGVVCFSTVGFFTAVLAPLINRKHISISELLLSGLTLCGIALIFHFDTRYRTGIIFGLLSSLTGAFYTIANERLTRYYDSHTIIHHEILGGWLGFSLLLPFYCLVSPAETWVPSGEDALYLLLLSLFCTIGMYFLMVQALRSIPAFTVSLSCNLEPVYSIILAVFFFEEGHQLTGAFFAGMGLIILSVLLQVWKDR